MLNFAKLPRNIFPLFVIIYDLPVDELAETKFPHIHIILFSLV